MRKLKSNVCVLLACFLLFGAVVFSPQTAEAATPRAWFEGYAGGNTGNTLRVSQLIEVKTSGFADNAILNYYYSTNWTAWLFGNVETFSRSNMLYPNFSFVNDDSEVDRGDKRFFALMGSSSRSKWVKVRVEDINPESTTYGRSATHTQNGFQAASLQQDIASSSYGMFTGEGNAMLNLLAEAGLTHITCSNSIIDECTLVSSSPEGCITVGDGSLYVLKAITPGTAAVTLRMHKTDKCSYHPGQSASSTMYFKVFKDPVEVAGVTDITLKADSLERGVTYTINGVSKTFDGTNDLVFSNLAMGNEYTLTMEYKNPNNLISKKTKEIQTRDHYVVTLNVMGRGRDLTEERKPGTKVVTVPEFEGYVFEGWYDNTAFRGQNYLNSVGINNDITLYAKWRPAKYFVAYDKNSAAATGTMQTGNFTYDEAQSIALNKFEWTGYTFKHWYTIPATRDFPDGDEVINLSPIDQSTVTLLAMWEINRYQVSYNTQGHGTIGWEPANESYEHGQSIPSTRDLFEVGWDFGGWYDNPACEGADYRTEPLITDLSLYAKWTARRYTARVNLTLDGDPYPGQSVQLLKNGKLAYDLSFGDGLYTNEGVAMGNYDVYLNGKDTGLDMLFDGVAPGGTVFDIALYGYTASVHVTKNGEPLSGREVTLRLGETTAASLSGSGGSYTQIVYLMDISSATQYSVIINGQDTNAKLSFGGGGEDIAEATVRYYDVEASLNLDDSPWSGTTVTLQRNGAIVSTLKGSGGQYRAEMILVEENGGSELLYDLVIEGAYSGRTIPGICSDSRIHNLDYYTLTYKDGDAIKEENRLVHSTQIIKSGETGTMPMNPYRPGMTFSGWSNGKIRGQSTDPITSPTAITASWETPKVINGDHVRCDASGAITQTGPCYRLANLTITGFPGGTSKPLRIAHIDVYKNEAKERDDSTISFVSRAGYSVTGSGTDRVVSLSGGNVKIAGVGTGSVTITADSGVGYVALQGFLRNCMVVSPAPSQTHTIHVRVFGSTV